MMSPRRRATNALLLTGWSVLLTALTGVLGAIPMRALRLVAGAVGFWMLGLLAAAAMGFAGYWLLGLLFLAMVTATGLFAEFEERGHSLVASGFGSIAVTVMMAAGAFAFWVAQQGSTWFTVATTTIEGYLAAVPAWQETVKVEAKDVLRQIPSAAVIMLMMGLFFGLLFERRLMVLLGIRRAPVHRLARFAVPEAFIWVVVLGLVGTFLLSKSTLASAVGVNLLNVAAAVFYLQGLAVVTSYFESFRVGWFWQVAIWVLLVTQLFVLLSAIGLVDYWVDFRTRMAKRSEELDREIFKK